MNFPSWEGKWKDLQKKHLGKCGDRLIQASTHLYERGALWLSTKDAEDPDNEDHYTSSLLFLPVVSVPLLYRFPVRTAICLRVG
jgi:hypothetical protein